ncbi:MAG: formimidoylglutamate deiminase [Rhizobiaceae bacterium]
MKILANRALMPSGWDNDIIVDIDGGGKIATIGRAGDTPLASQIDHRVDILLPAPVNVHSHGFQRAMAGLTESRGPQAKDSFWSWRKLMFRFLKQLTPDHVEAIAAFVQMEMLQAGYATNVEFHYLHHQADGRPYGRIAEMAERIAAATMASGIGLTMLPVHYQFGGCDQRPLAGGQLRFGTDIETFGLLFEQSEDALRSLPNDSQFGLAPHSLRAVARESFAPLVELAAGRPIHMHLAEQFAEVDEVQSHWNSRPVEWVLDNLDITEQWCLIHCTQMLAHETRALAQTGTVAGLCPITESSLGDGIFDGVRWLEHGGSLAIGSDSNIRISLSEEMRTLDHSQRLRDNTRAALASPDKSTARRIFESMLMGGAQAAGRKCGKIEQGYWADLIGLDHSHIDLTGLSGDLLLDSFAFAGDDRLIIDVWSAGRHLVRQGRHINHHAITKAYRQVMLELRSGL